VQMKSELTNDGLGVGEGLLLISCAAPVSETAIAPPSGVAASGRLHFPGLGSKIA